MLFWGTVTALWLLGAVASSSVQCEMGKANPLTIGDCFTGDYGLDLVCVVFWPIFWPCWAAHRLASFLYRMAV